MTYVDGFLIPLPAGNVDSYRDMATLAGRLWMEHGALSYVEAVADDITSEHTKNIPKMAGMQDGETVVFAFITYNSRAHRDEVNAKVMADPRLADICPAKNPDNPNLFDPARMGFGGFKAVVSL